MHLGPFEQFHYPDYAAGIFAGVCLMALSLVLTGLGAHPLLTFFLRYLGMLMSFFGVVWYGFNWFIDHGVKYI